MNYMNNYNAQTKKCFILRLFKKTLELTMKEVEED